MAPRAGELERVARQRLGELLEPTPGRLGFALRIALVCALTTLVVEYYRLPEPALIAYVGFFVVKPDRATSVLLSVVFVVLISVVVGLLLLLARAVIDEPFWRVTAMAVISFGLLFAGSASKLRPVAPIVALITAYALDLLSRAEIGELATRGYLYGWLFVAIPAGVSIVVNLLAGPAPRRLAARALAGRLRLCAAMLGEPDAETRAAFAAGLREGPGEVPAWLRLAALEKTSPAAELAALRQAAASTTEIQLLVELVARDAGDATPEAVRAGVAQVLCEMAAILDAGGYPVEAELPGIEGERDLPALAAAALADLRQVVARFAEPPPAPPAPAKPAKPAGGGFFVADAFSNPEHVRYALKTTAAAMFCYVVYTLLDWPGIHTALITCYIVSLGTAAETIEKLSLRVLGCLAGAATGVAAIVFVMPGLTSITGLLAVVFPAALVSAWVAAGGPRVSYAGFQIAFAFFLCVIQGSAPAFDMTIARDRVIGILFGDLVVYLLFTSLWPVSVARRIDPAIAALLRRLSGMAAAVSLPQRAALVGQAQAARATLEQDLELAGYEPAALRPDAPWLQARRRAVDEMAALEAPLLLTAAQADGGSGEAARRLDRLAGQLGDPAAALDEDARRPPPSRATAARALIEAHMARLEQALATPAAEAGRDHAPA